MLNMGKLCVALHRKEAQTALQVLEAHGEHFSAGEGSISGGGCT